jgi:hypothetical protein
VLYIKYLSYIVKGKICLQCGYSGVLFAVKVKCGLCVYLRILVRIKNQWACYFHFKMLEVVCVCQRHCRSHPAVLCYVVLLTLASHRLLIICYCQLQ